MSSNGAALAHGHSCPCWECKTRFLAATGSGFGLNGTRPVAGGSNPSPDGQLTQAQVDQGNLDLDALTSSNPFQQNFKLWDDDRNTAARFRQGPIPTQHPYAMELEIDEPPPQIPHQQQYNGPKTTYAPTITQKNQLHPRASSTVDASASYSQVNSVAFAPAGHDGNLRSNAGGSNGDSGPMGQESSHEYYQHTTSQQMPRAGPSRHPKSVARRSSTADSSSGQETPESRSGRGLS